MRHLLRLLKGTSETRCCRPSCCRASCSGCCPHPASMEHVVVCRRCPTPKDCADAGTCKPEGWEPGDDRPADWEPGD